jgi:hypothetical protein
MVMIDLILTMMNAKATIRLKKNLDLETAMETEELPRRMEINL